MLFLYVLFFSKYNSKLEREWQPLLREKTSPTASPKGDSDEAMNDMPRF